MLIDGSMKYACVTDGKKIAGSFSAVYKTTANIFAEYL